MKFKVFIQARMSSSRFPGKVLAPLGSRPMINWVLDGVSRVLSNKDIVVATSTEASDDPLVSYLRELGVDVFRGPLQDVFERFRQCLQAHPCDWFFRISADSPLLNSSILRIMMPYADPALDLVTNVLKRTFPHGHSVELLNASTFSNLDVRQLSEQDREHVTRFYYFHQERFRILNLENLEPDYSRLNFVVDTLDDLRRVEAMQSSTSYDFEPRVAVSA